MAIVPHREQLLAYAQDERDGEVVMLDAAGTPMGGADDD